MGAAAMAGEIGDMDELTTISRLFSLTYEQLGHHSPRPSSSPCSKLHRVGKTPKKTFSPIVP